MGDKNKKDDKAVNKPDKNTDKKVDKKTDSNVKNDANQKEKESNNAVTKEKLAEKTEDSKDKKENKQNKEDNTQNNNSQNDDLKSENKNNKPDDKSDKANKNEKSEKSDKSDKSEKSVAEKKAPTKKTKKDIIKEKINASNKELIAEAVSVGVGCLCLLITLGIYFGGGGVLGQALGNVFRGLFGFGGYILPLAIIGCCVYMFFAQEKVLNATKLLIGLGMFFMLLCFMHVIHIDGTKYHGFLDFTQKMYKNGYAGNGGLFGAYIGTCFYKAIGKGCSIIISLIILIALGVVITGKSLSKSLKSVWDKASEYFVFDLGNDEYTEDYIEEEVVTEKSTEKPTEKSKFNFLGLFKKKKEEEPVPEPKEKEWVDKDTSETRQRVKARLEAERQKEREELERIEKEKQKKKVIHREVPAPTVININPDDKPKDEKRIDILLNKVRMAQKEIDYNNIKMPSQMPSRPNSNIELPHFLKNQEDVFYQKLMEDNMPRINGVDNQYQNNYQDNYQQDYQNNYDNSYQNSYQSNNQTEEQTLRAVSQTAMQMAREENLAPQRGVENLYNKSDNLNNNSQAYFDDSKQETILNVSGLGGFLNHNEETQQTEVSENENQKVKDIITKDRTIVYKGRFLEYQNNLENKQKQNINQNINDENNYKDNKDDYEDSYSDIDNDDDFVDNFDDDLLPWSGDDFDDSELTSNNINQGQANVSQPENRIIQNQDVKNQDNRNQINQRQTTQNQFNLEPTTEPDENEVTPVIVKAEKTKTVNEIKATEEVKREYVFPKLEFLGKNPSLGKNKSNEIELLENSKILVKTLASFNVEAQVIEISKGPAVTRYELAIQDGIKVSKILGLADNLALSLAATSIRIEAPIPGKSAVGIEIPNKEITSVYLSEVICSDKFQDFKSKLAFGLGKDIAGNVIVTDIAKMPHMLIAGATGSGKSVCINTLITSILYKSSPEEVKLIMVDPKVVELSVYNGIPHLLIPVVTEPEKAAGALNWAVGEMMERYGLFAKTGIRNLKGYNEIMEKNGEKKLPQIVIIIDELADLMMVASKEVEAAICRLAQLARAAGIHLIIATQRPSVDVITGLIKANIPSRIAFAVSSGTDSRTIIDTVGAEKLLGKGDMLFKAVDMNKPLRVQGAFVTDHEIEEIVTYLKENNPVTYDDDVINKIESSASKSDATIGGSSDSASDELTDEVISFVVRAGKCSTSLVQRKFRLGYNRAARIVEELEDRGIVGPENGSKPREVLMDKYQMEEYFTRNSGY